MPGSRSVIVLAVGASGLAAATAFAAAAVTRDVTYDRGSPPLSRALNTLDVHVPDGSRADRRPVVVLVHGGGWSSGDKRSFGRDKTRALTDAGYIVVNVNYRLSPRDPLAILRTGRVRHPAHAEDVAEAVGWVHDEIARYGGDPGRIALLGHSAGAHLVSLVGTDRRYLRRARVPAGAVRAVVSLDTEAYDVARRVRTSRGRARTTVTNAFGTPAEERRRPLWRAASPLTHADRGDPPELVVTQTRNAERRRGAERFATALGQRPADVLALPYTHAQISRNLGAADDPAGETTAVLVFLARHLQVK